MIATFMVMYANSHRKKGKPRYRVADFLPDYGRANRQHKPKTDADWIAVQERLVASMGGEA